MNDDFPSQDPSDALQDFKRDILEAARKLGLPDSTGPLSSGIDVETTQKAAASDPDV